MPDTKLRPKHNEK